jgi:Cys-tRNA(Pro)/Cys-tRNA(Cys) deacylase
MPALRPGPAPAVTALVRHGVEFSLHPYDVAEYDDGAELAELLDVEDDRVLEVVVVEAGGRPVLCIVIAGDEVDEAAVEATVGVPARVAVESLVERATGHPADAVSPFGLRRRLPVLVDEAVVALAATAPSVTVVVASGQVGLAVEVALSDLLRLTGAQPAPIATSPPD